MKRLLINVLMTFNAEDLKWLKTMCKRFYILCNNCGWLVTDFRKEEDNCCPECSVLYSESKSIREEVK